MCTLPQNSLAFGELTLLPPPGVTGVLLDGVPRSSTSDLPIDNSFMTFTFNTVEAPQSAIEEPRVSSGSCSSLTFFSPLELGGGE